MSRRLTGGLHLKVAYDDKSSWPFEWYLRDFDQRQFIGSSAGSPFDADVVILGIENEAANKAFLGNRYYRREYRLIWWPDQEFYFNTTLGSLWARLRDPVQRQEILDVVLRREYPRSTNDWYLVSRFALYVRRDFPAPVWLHGGPQEGGRRGGTENLPGVVGFAKACELAAARLAGLAEIPCIRLAHLTDAQRRAYILARKPESHAQLDRWTARRLEVGVEEPQKVEIDGDVIGETSSALIEIEPRSLIVRVSTAVPATPSPTA